MAGTNFLERFRPLGAPGAATVGAQASDDLGSAAELAPIFAALAPAVAECETIVVAAHHEADAHLVHARERAAAIRARARADVGAGQARAAARVLGEATARAICQPWATTPPADGWGTGWRDEAMRATRRGTVRSLSPTVTSSARV